jgi:uncharacterized RDD family membrane protein YckC
VSVAPGWYPDPADPAVQRYWDGEQWVGGAVPVSMEPPAVPPPAWPRSVEPPLPQPSPADLARPGPTLDIGAPADGFADQGFMPILALPVPPFLRLVARMIDICMVTGLVMIVNSYFFYRYYQEVAPQVEAVRRQLAGGAAAPPLTLSDTALRLILIMTVTAFALWFAYEVPATANSGQTLGKRLLGIRVQRLDGSRLTFWQSVRRWLVLAIPAMLLQGWGLPLQLVDCAWCTWDKPLRQCLHDKSVLTVVVAAVPRPPAAPLE